MKNNLKELRIARGLSQSALAEKAGTTKRTIYAIESENQDIRISLAHRLVKVLGCGIDDLYAADDGTHTATDKALWFAHIVRHVSDEIGKPIRDTTKLLERTGIARRIITGYDVWHTQGYEYMAEVLADELSSQGK